MIAALLRAPWARLLRTRRARVAVGAWGVIAVAFAIAAHASGGAHPADRVLLEAYGPLVLPLLAYSLVGAVVGVRALSAAAAPLVSFGAPPARAAFVSVAVAAAACMVAGGFFAAVVDVLAHGLTHPPYARDAIASAYAGALGGAAYAGWFSLGASFGKGGGGRLVFLVGDWLLGDNDGIPALFTPRGHLRNLLGGTPPMDLSERVSAGVLVAIAAIGVVVATTRVRR